MSATTEDTALQGGRCYLHQAIGSAKTEVKGRGQQVGSGREKVHKWERSLERVGASRIQGSPVWEAATKDGALELGKKLAHKRKVRWIVTRTYWLYTIFFNIVTNLRTD